MSGAERTHGGFRDDKAPDAMRTIGEVADALGVKPHVLRYWEQQFPMLSPLKRSGGRRLYRSQDISLLEQISRLVNEEGYTLKGARAAIEASASGKPEPSHAQLVTSLKTIRSRLARALAS